jgi:hypothetical protein
MNAFAKINHKKQKSYTCVHDMCDGAVVIPVLRELMHIANVNLFP